MVDLRRRAIFDLGNDHHLRGSYLLNPCRTNNDLVHLLVHDVAGLVSLSLSLMLLGEVY